MDFRWLHFSDLHMGLGNGERTLWGQAKGALLDDLDRLTQDHGPWDLVLFTGDIAQSGDKPEYDQFDAEVLGPILARLGGPVVLAVPGNHDLARPTTDEEKDRALAADLQAEVALASGTRAALADTWLKHIGDRFRAYQAWWQRHKPSGVHEGPLPGDWSYTFEKDGALIGLVGLNSAWSHWRDDRGERSLNLSRRQIEHAVVGPLETWHRRHHLAFLLTHHPPTWLDNEGRTALEQAAQQSGVFAHLFGHMHELTTYSEERNETSEGWRNWQAASLFGLERWGTPTIPHDKRFYERRVGYSAGQIRFGGGEGATYTLWPRQGIDRTAGKYEIVPDTRFPLALAHAPSTPERPFGLTRPWQWAPRTGSVEGVSDPSLWSEGVTVTQLWRMLADRPGVEELCAAVQAVIVDCAGLVEAEAADSDRWMDCDYPLRVLEQAGRLLGAHKEVDSATLALLLIAPFVREAGLALAQRDPRFQDTLESLKAQFPALAMAMLDEASPQARGIRQWLTHRAALLHHARRPDAADLLNRPSLGRLYERLDGAMLRQQRIEHLRRLQKLGPLIGGDPRRCIDAASEPLTVQRDGPDGRVLGAILCVAGHLALDARRLDAAVPAQLRHRPDVVSPLPALLGEAGWRREGGTWTLELDCPSQVLDYAIRELLAAGERACRELRTLEVSLSPLWAHVRVRLPSSLSADGLQPLGGAYKLPHTHVQLDHQRVRALLMGENLWGDPAVAIRELYQNALDACRYRQAREELLKRRGDPMESSERRIVFRQGLDPDRGPYVECEDTGVGMSGRHLQELFAFVGRRFVDDDEFLRDEADWRAQGITFTPNSRFGIGVMSYWLLADRVEVWTRRLLPDGYEDEALHVEINSVDGLFHIQPDPETQSVGTRIRLWLRDAAASARATLSKLLWFAEFHTRVEDEDGTLAWPAGELTIHAPELKEKNKDVVKVPDKLAWWVLGTDVMGRGLLVDGLLTSRGFPMDQRRSDEIFALQRSNEAASASADWFLVNLTGEQATQTRLKTDRTEVWWWPSGWLDEVVRDHWRLLLAGDRLTLTDLIAMEGRNAPILVELWNALKHPRRLLRVRRPTDSEPAPPCAVPDALGLWGDDPPKAEEHRPSTSRGASIVNTHAAWRRHVWQTQKLVNEHVWHPLTIFDAQRAPVPDPGDHRLLRSLDRLRRGDQWRYRDGAFHPSFAHLLEQSEGSGLEIPAILDRWRAYAPSRLAPEHIEVPEGWARLAQQLRGVAAWTGRPREVLSAILDGDIASPHSTVAALVRIAADRRATIRSVLDQTRELLGDLVALPVLSESVIDLLDQQPPKVLASLLEVFWASRVPLAGRAIPAGHMRSVELEFRLPAGSLWQQIQVLEPLGITAATPWEVVQQLELDATDLKLLSRATDNGRTDWWETVKLSGLEAWGIAQKVGLSGAEAARRLERLAPLGIEVDERGLSWLADAPNDELQRALFPLTMMQNRNVLHRHDGRLPALHFAPVIRRTGARPEFFLRIEQANEAGLQVIGDPYTTWRGSQVPELAAVEPHALDASAWHFALIAIVSASAERPGGLHATARHYIGTGVLPMGEQLKLALQGSTLHNIAPHTLATLVWAWRDHDPTDTTPPAQALYDLTRHLAWWEREDRLRDLTRDLVPVLQWLEDHWARRDDLPTDVVI